MTSDYDSKPVYSDVKTVTFESVHTITVLPIPARDNICITDDTGDPMTAVSLFNPSGVLLRQFSDVGSGSRIDIGNYPPGIYFLRITDKSGNSTIKKVIKTK
ncbi:T9SS type A sorting domain-containing protein [Puia sp.]|uniref:T9SS type A sorting domain-containing protein n=1 Tax=Puia sp. TaxID=2045100 RepID=UPI0039C93EB0